MKLITQRFMPLLFPLALSACGISTQSASTLHAEDDAATVVVWSEYGFIGEQYTTKVTPGTERQASKTVNLNYEALTLQNRISSARLSCGKRKAQVSFSDSADTFGSRIVATCEPGESKTIDFHSTPAKDGAYLADKIVWYNLVVHAEGHAWADISEIVVKDWDAKVKDKLPYKVSTARGSQATWVNARYFEIKQDMKIDDSLCDGSTVYLIYKVGLGTRKDEASGWGVLPYWEVDSYRLYFSDTYCEAQYRGAIWTALGENVSVLEEGLNLMTKGTKTTYYLTPSDSYDKVYASWGNRVDY